MGSYLCTEMLGGMSRAQCAHNGSSEVVDTRRAGTYRVCAAVMHVKLRTEHLKQRGHNVALHGVF